MYIKLCAIFSLIYFKEVPKQNSSSPIFHPAHHLIQIRVQSEGKYGNLGCKYEKPMCTSTITLWHCDLFSRKVSWACPLSRTGSVLSLKCCRGSGSQTTVWGTVHRPQCQHSHCAKEQTHHPLSPFVALSLCVFIYLFLLPCSRHFCVFNFIDKISLFLSVIELLALFDLTNS